MNEDKLISIVLYGKISTEKKAWERWYKYSKQFIHRLNYDANYISIESTTINSGKILTLKRAEKKILSAIEKGEEIEWISLYSLPNHFKSAAFDYDVSLIRNRSYICITLKENDYLTMNSKIIIQELANFVDIEEGEIYSMSREECPPLYAARLNPDSMYKTLEIIEKISM